MTEQTDRIAALVGMTIDDAVAEFATLDDAALKALFDAEENSSKRKGLLAAIKSEQGAREHQGKVSQIVTLAAESGVKVYTEDEVNALRAEHDERISALEAKLGVVADAGVVEEVTTAKARKLVIGRATAAPAIIAFTGDDDTTLPDLADLTFRQSAFAVNRSREMLELHAPIEFPVSARRAEITKVWLLDANEVPVSFVRLVGPVTIGGSSRTRLPSGFLAFPRMEPAADDSDDD